MNDDPFSPPGTDISVPYQEDDRVKLWLPQATSLAEQGKSQLLIQQFFKGKGVPEDVAHAAASDLFNKFSKQRSLLQLPFKIIGWLLILVGGAELVMILLGFGGYPILAAGGVALGIFFVFVMCPKRGAAVNL